MTVSLYLEGPGSTSNREQDVVRICSDLWKEVEWICV